jgi:hypothetical protein
VHLANILFDRFSYIYIFDSILIILVLLNPTAAETLSESNYLRLEIGTSPDTLEYQTKVADYLWFSSSPKVNMVHRMMNG